MATKKTPEDKLEFTLDVNSPNFKKELNLFLKKISKKKVRVWNQTGSVWCGFTGVVKLKKHTGADFYHLIEVRDESNWSYILLEHVISVKSYSHGTYFKMKNNVEICLELKN